MSTLELLTMTERALGADPVSVDSVLDVLTQVQCSASAVRMLGECVKGIEKLMTVPVVKRWPETGIGLLAKLIANIPYQPDVMTYPCGRRELFIAEILRDHSLPKTVRAQFWKLLVMDGLGLPNYSRGVEWRVPRELIDHPAIRSWYCALENKGSDVVRCSDAKLFGLPCEVPVLNNAMLKKAFTAIDSDSPAQLMMPLSVMGVDLPKEFFYAALQAKASKIIAYLLSSGTSAKCGMTNTQLLFYVCANWNNDLAIPVVALIEKLEPGIMATAADVHGRTPLWYTFYQRNFLGKATPAARRAMDPLDRELIHLGCDPDAENDLGLSYNDIAELETHA